MHCTLKTALRDIHAAATRMNTSNVKVITEKALELRLRHAFRLLPNDSIKDVHFLAYLEEVLGAQPPAGMETCLYPVKRGQRLDPVEYEFLETRQNYRCAVCGAILNRAANPHVDHIFPVSLGGNNDVENLQLLCDRCNLGKSNAIHWLMLNPFFTEAIHKVSVRLAYCVFSRDESRCTEQECNETSRSSQLIAITHVPVQRGGRLIFDNLRTVCETHEAELRNARYLSARQRVNAVRMGLSL
jgi:hypothetical protein